MSYELDELDDRIFNVIEEISDFLSTEDWDSYDNDDLYGIMAFIFGDKHPLVKKYNELNNKIVEERKKES